jgi:DNA-binding NarL/FixJ family response regulator
MARPQPAGAAAWERRLSPREREVTQGAARGLTNRQLARDLAMSSATVKAHLNRIFQKLGVHSRAELAAVCLGLKSLAR